MAKTPEGENPVPLQDTSSTPQDFQAELAPVQQDLDLMEIKWKENETSFTQRADLTQAYKLEGVAERLRSHFSGPIQNKEQLQRRFYNGFESGLFHDILRADLDLSSYPSEDPNWKKISDSIHAAAELIRLVAAKVDHIIDNPKLFEIPQKHVETEYMIESAISSIPEMNQQVNSLLREGKNGFLVSVRVFSVSKSGQRLSRTLGVLPSPGEWRN